MPGGFIENEKAIQKLANWLSEKRNRSVHSNQTSAILKQRIALVYIQLFSCFVTVRICLAKVLLKASPANSPFISSYLKVFLLLLLNIAVTSRHLLFKYSDATNQMSFRTSYYLQHSEVAKMEVTSYGAK